jgi:hypothetical protein
VEGILGVLLTEGKTLELQIPDVLLKVEVLILLKLLGVLTKEEILLELLEALLEEEEVLLVEAQEILLEEEVLLVEPRLVPEIFVKDFEGVWSGASGPEGLAEFPTSGLVGTSVVLLTPLAFASTEVFFVDVTGTVGAGALMVRTFTGVEASSLGFFKFFSVLLSECPTLRFFTV